MSNGFQPPNQVTPTGLRVTNDVTGNGITGESRDGTGVVGVTTQGDPGVYGTADADRASGVAGLADNGVSGWGTRVGVYGEAFPGRDTWAGVRGVGPANGVEGDSQNGHGVYGWTNDGDGVFGFTARNGAAILGYAPNSSGVLAASDSKDAPALHAIANGAGASAWFDGFAIFFGGHIDWGNAGIVGDCNVWGDLNVLGHKNAAVPHPDGSHRLLYSVESPESWFEDFGRARIVRGRASVKLDRTFAAVVRTGDYHVFLSPEGESKGLYVSRRTRSGFEVREHQRGASTLRFSYRIVARRRDIVAPRFKKVTLRKPVKPAASLRRKLLGHLRAPTLPARAAAPRFPGPRLSKRTTGRR